MTATDTKTQLLDAAQELCQTRGYNAFSYRDLADRVGIRTASIHHHFPTKGDLGEALAERYRGRFQTALSEIDASPADHRRKLEKYLDLFHGTLKVGHRMCLGGMLATEYDTLPKAVQAEVRRFFEGSEQWLAALLAEGRKAGAFAFDGSPAATARTVFAAMEGAMMAARTFHDESRLAVTARWLQRALATDQ